MNRPADAPLTELRYGAQTLERRQDDSIRSFRADRLGQFIHWGLYSMPAGVWKGRTYDVAGEFLPKAAGISPAEWATLAGEFRAEAFDAEEWARTAKVLGARYVTLTTKHHDGFCLWPSDTGDLTIAATPFGRDGRDPVGELVDAYTRAGISVHLYYSVLDWHHPDWRYTIESPEDRAAFDRYLKFAEGQLRELATRYPQVRGFWFDGTWDESVKANGAWTLAIELMLKELLPGVVINSRLRADDLGARHLDSNGHLMADYESGFERRLPAPWDTSVTERDWEACLTLTQWSWGHHTSPAASATRKSAPEVIELIAHTTSLAGNVLVNFGPDGTGRFVAEERAVADQVGSWLSQYGAAVYGCGHAEGWGPPVWGFYTMDPESNVVYAIVTRVPLSGVALVQLPEGTRLRSITHVGTQQSVDVVVREPRQIAVPIDRSLHLPEVFALEIEDATPPASIEVNPDVVQ